VLEDAAQAIGARRKGKGAGTLADGATFSFFPSKNLGGAGDGGLVAGNDAAWLERVKRLRVHGGAKQYVHDEVGMNSRLDEIQAAVLDVKLKHLDAWTDGRRKNADRYRALLKDVSEIVLPADDPDGRHIYNQFTILADRRDQLKEHLTAAGVGNAIYYPICLHLQQCFADWGYKKGQFPVSEKCSERALSIPVFGELTESQVEHVADSIRSFYRGAKRATA
jgi:dTDP-4-amino-4,6-dideoxygalactose transaminase